MFIRKLKVIEKVSKNTILTYDLSFFFSHMIDWFVYMLMLRVQSTASFFVLMLGISYKVCMSIEIPIQLQRVVSTF